MDLKDLKYLSKSKRMTMGNCVLGMIFADGKQTDSEWNVAANLLTTHLDITGEELKANILKGPELIRRLQTLDGNELVALGLLMGVMSLADGHAHKKELDRIRGTLMAGRLRSDQIEEIISWVKSKG